MGTERLLQIKDQINKAKTTQSEVKGQIAGVWDNAKTRFKISELPEASKKLSEMGAKLDQEEVELKSGEEKLEAAYPWE